MGNGSNGPVILEQENAAAKQEDLELGPRLLDQRGRHLTQGPSDGDPHHAKSRALFSRGSGGSLLVMCAHPTPTALAR